VPPAEAPALGLGLPRRPSRQGEAGQGGEAFAELGLESGGAEQAAYDQNGDQCGIGGAEDPGEEGIPGEVIGVVFLTQCLDEVPAVGDESVEGVEDVADAGRVEARGRGPIGIGVLRLGWGGGGVGHGRYIRTRPERGQELFPSGVEVLRRCGRVGVACGARGGR